MYATFIEVNLENTSKLDSLVLGACTRSGVDLVEKDLFGAGNRKILRIFIDRDGGVSVENCASTSRYLSEELDKEENADLIDGSYIIEVSSPGLDRPLKTKRDFERNLGRRLRITQNGKLIKGVLKSVNGVSIVLETTNANGKKPATEACIQVNEILTAKVEP
ncbi:MAG: ribosome maturation factor RimP [Fibromonadales bacterium]|nr:ribosome maturation factor RimP [Fibromonadales bacterium]